MAEQGFTLLNDSQGKIVKHTSGLNAHSSSKFSKPRVSKDKIGR